MDEPTIPQSAAFHIQLPTFEGPLDLLLHLIRKHELQILDLPIAFVTERYLEYLSMMQELDLDLASEYLLMAATLAHIKSKMLLPQVASADALEEQEDAYQEDPRAELIRRLLEYQKYKAAADQLGARPLSGRDVFPRGTPALEAQGPAPLAGIELYKLLDAFQGILKRVSGRVLEVSAERITIHERMTQLSELLRLRRRCTFEELFESARTRYEVVVTFLALLEMTKLRMTRVFQTDPQSPLHVQYALLDADATGDGSPLESWDGTSFEHPSPISDEAPTTDMPAPLDSENDRVTLVAAEAPPSAAAWGEVSEADEEPTQKLQDVEAVRLRQASGPPAGIDTADAADTADTADADPDTDVIDERGDPDRTLRVPLAQVEAHIARSEAEHANEPDDDTEQVDKDDDKP